jgi:hypothetical protein
MLASRGGEAPARSTDGTVGRAPEVDVDLIAGHHLVEHTPSRRAQPPANHTETAREHVVLRPRRAQGISTPARTRQERKLRRLLDPRQRRGHGSSSQAGRRRPGRRARRGRRQRPDRREPGPAGRASARPAAAWARRGLGRPLARSRACTSGAGAPGRGGAWLRQGRLGPRHPPGAGRRRSRGGPAAPAGGRGAPAPPGPVGRQARRRAWPGARRPRSRAIGRTGER